LGARKNAAWKKQTLDTLINEEARLFLERGEKRHAL
jgi:hypothetical protein